MFGLLLDFHEMIIVVLLKINVAVVRISIDNEFDPISEHYFPSF